MHRAHTMQSFTDTENVFWNTQLRAMKTMKVGAVGDNCSEANLTHCGPNGGHSLAVVRSPSALWDCAAPLTARSSIASFLPVVTIGAN